MQFSKQKVFSQILVAKTGQPGFDHGLCKCVVQLIHMANTQEGTVCVK